MTQDALSSFEMSPGVYVFRHRLTGKQRRDASLTCLLTALLATATSLMLWKWGNRNSDTLVAIVATLPVFSGLFLLFGAFTWLIPQTALRISPRSIAWVDSGCRLFSRRARHWSVRWSDISRLKWYGGACAIVAHGRKHRARAPLPSSQGQAVREVLEMHLGRYFDIAAGTVEQRRRMQSADWTWSRWWIDKLELVLCSLGISITQLLFLALIMKRFDIALVLLPLTAFTIDSLIRYGQFGWQEPSSASSNGIAAKLPN